MRCFIYKLLWQQCSIFIKRQLTRLKCVYTVESVYSVNHINQTCVKYQSQKIIKFKYM